MYSHYFIKRFYIIVCCTKYTIVYGIIYTYNLEDRYSLKVIYKQGEQPDPDFNDAKLGNVEISLEIILKSRIPDGLKIR